MTDQIRVRHHVYGIKRTELPQIGSDSSLAASLRLEKELRAVVVKPLPMKLHVSAFNVRARHPAPTSAAIAFDQAHVHQVHEAWMKLIDICNQGVFVAGRAAMGLRGGSRRAHPLPSLAEDVAAADDAGDESDILAVPVADIVLSGIQPPAGDAVDVLGAPVAGIAMCEVQPPRRIASNDSKLTGKFVVHDDTQWRVLKVEWQVKAKSVVAWYYSVQDAALEGYDFSTMKVRFESNNLDSPAIVYADIDTIRAWAKNANFSGASS